MVEMHATNQTQFRRNPQSASAINAEQSDCPSPEGRTPSLSQPHEPSDSGCEEGLPQAPGPSARTCQRTFQQRRVLVDDIKSLDSFVRHHVCSLGADKRQNHSYPAATSYVAISIPSSLMLARPVARSTRTVRLWYVSSTVSNRGHPSKYSTTVSVSYNYYVQAHDEFADY